MTRAELARNTGINEASLKRYELAGLPGGQYPPAPKLAKICFHLNLSSAEALFSCLDDSYYDETAHKRDTASIGAGKYRYDVINHPEHQFVRNENYYLGQDNARLRAILRFLVLEEDSGWAHAPRIKEWLKAQLEQQFGTLQKLETELIAKGAIAPLDSFSFSPVLLQEADGNHDWLPTIDDLHRDSFLSDPNDEQEPTLPKALEAMKGPAGEKQKLLLQRAIELINQIRNEEGPDQSPNSPGPSENK